MGWNIKLLKERGGVYDGGGGGGEVGAGGSFNITRLIF